MNAKELGANIGKQGLLSISGLQVLVNVTDARTVFGRTDFQVTPVNGVGSTWVESNRVTSLQEAI